ncbi:MAG: glyceraldehyde 3-phosphate dehydrogenase NAD-binding domain-containing protein, partial [Patescibacteria group bacterium]
MAIKIAINGFGRIGRSFFQVAFLRPEFEIVAVNDLGDVNNLAYLLQYDSVYKKYEKEVKAEAGNLIVDGKKVKFVQEKDPTKLPWKDLGVDVVIESTGVFTSYEKAKMHLDAGAKRVVITAPAKDGGPIITATPGINEENLKNCPITSNASCTTNA